MRSLLILLILTCNAYGFEDSAFQLSKHEYNDRTEYAGKQRYDIEFLRHDPEVLVSSANKPVVYEARKQDSVIEAKDKDPDVIVSSCVEYNGKCEPSTEFKTKVTQ
jgi:hypothetical protein